MKSLCRKSRPRDRETHLGSQTRYPSLKIGSASALSGTSIFEHIVVCAKRVRSLFRKEWRELRGIRCISPVFAIAAILLFEMMDRLAWGRRVWHVDSGLAHQVATVVWVLCAGVIGASLVVPEVGSGTLQFLSSLPVSRARLWTAKVAASVASIIMCAIWVTLGLVVSLALLGETHGAYSASPFASVEGDPTPAIVAAGLGAFACGLLTSTLSDRTSGASVAAILLFLSFAAVLGSVGQSAVCNFFVTHSITPFDPVIAAIEAAIVILCLLGGAYYGFTGGESLKTGKRYWEVARGIGAVALVVIVLPVLAYCWLVW